MLAKHKCSALLIHHTNKNQTAKGQHRSAGADGLNAITWANWLMEGDHHSLERTLAITGRCAPSRHKIKFHPDEEWSSHGCHYLYQGDSDQDAGSGKLKDQIVQLLRKSGQEMEVSEVASAISGNEKTVGKTLSQLAAQKIILSKPSPNNHRARVYFVSDQDNSFTSPP